MVRRVLSALLASTVHRRLRHDEPLFSERDAGQATER
jgi:hypothetical protein